MLNFYDCDKNLSENDFNEVEKKLEVSFPSSFKSHYLKWNGGTPNLSCFEMCIRDSYISISLFYFSFCKRFFRQKGEQYVSQFKKYGA